MLRNLRNFLSTNGFKYLGQLWVDEIGTTSKEKRTSDWGGEGGGGADGVQPVQV